MFNSEMISLVGVAFWESIYMTIISSFFAYVIGLPLGLILVATDKDGIAEGVGAKERQESCLMT